MLQCELPTGEWVQPPAGEDVVYLQAGTIFEMWMGGKVKAQVMVTSFITFTSKSGQGHGKVKATSGAFCRNQLGKKLPNL